MEAAVIINPVAGAHGAPEAGRRRAEVATRILGQLRVDAEVFLTDGPGAARELARRAVDAGARTVFAWGGDGTVNEVASSLAFGPAALAIIPAGSGNGLARELGIPRDPERALTEGIHGLLVRIDLGEIDGRLYVNVAGVGLDAWVASRVNRKGHRRGFVPYLTGVLDGFLRYVPEVYDIEAEGLALRRTALLIAAANARQYGYGAIIAPMARPDDGMLDLIIVEPRPAAACMWQARRLFDGSFAQTPGVLARRAGRIQVTAAGPLLYHADGEVFSGGARLEIRVHPGGLAVRRPALASALLPAPAAGPA